MYYCITGILTVLENEFAVIDCGGVGYMLYISQNTHSELAKMLDKQAKLYTYLNVKEDALTLYGFLSTEELSVFKHLIGVSGVGPKAAMSILSSMTVTSFAYALSSNDARLIAKSPGVGLKTAQKIIIELRDKIAKEISAEDVPAQAAAPSGNQSDAINALVVLGFTRSQALAALRDIDKSLPLESIISQALKKLVK